MSFVGGKTFNLTKINSFPLPGFSIASVFTSMAVIVPDVTDAVSEIEKIANVLGDSMVTYKWVYCFDTGLETSEQHPFADELVNNDPTKLIDDISLPMVESREYNRVYNLAINGGLFFLGILLSIVFLFAAVLIIYYKQLSEGYEDQSRFEIMQKVGMTNREIRVSINSQLLTVFFLPLILAGIHMMFAFPIISRIIGLLGMSDMPAFLAAVAVSFAAFSLFYVLIYKITSNAYYRIVSGARPEQ